MMTCLFALVLAAVNSLHLVALYINPNSFIVSVAKFFSFAWHFDAAGKGLLDTRDIFFFIIAFLLFAFLAVSVFLLLSNFGVCGFIGNVISGFFFGLFGTITYLIPFYIFSRL